MDFSWLDISAEESKLEKIKEGALRVLSSGGQPTHWQMEAIDERVYPKMEKPDRELSVPPPGLAFSVGINESFVPGLEALLLSMKKQMPGFRDTVYVFHDGLTEKSADRISSAYPVTFMDSEIAGFGNLPVNSIDQKRIGIHGYMGAEGLRVRGHEILVVLEADMLFTGGVEGLWRGLQSYRAAANCDNRPYSPVSPFTKRLVLGSGVIVVPGRCLGSDTYEEFLKAMRDYCGKSICLHLDRFSSQKIWNVFLMNKDVEVMPLNLNCNTRYLAAYHGGVVDDVSILHFSGTKPWSDQAGNDERVRWATQYWHRFVSGRN